MGVFFIPEIARSYPQLTYAKSFTETSTYFMRWESNGGFGSSWRTFTYWKLPASYLDVARRVIHQQTSALLAHEQYLRPRSHQSLFLALAPGGFPYFPKIWVHILMNWQFTNKPECHEPMSILYIPKTATIDPRHLEDSHTKYLSRNIGIFNIVLLYYWYYFDI